MWMNHSLTPPRISWYWGSLLDLCVPSWQGRLHVIFLLHLTRISLPWVSEPRQINSNYYQLPLLLTPCSNVWWWPYRQNRKENQCSQFPPSPLPPEIWLWVRWAQVEDLIQPMGHRLPTTALPLCCIRCYPPISSHQVCSYAVWNNWNMNEQRKSELCMGTILGIHFSTPYPAMNNGSSRNKTILKYPQFLLIKHL